MAIATEYRPPGPEGTARLQVRGRVTFAEAPGFREALFAAIEAPDEARRLEVDLENVERMDTSGLAVLVEGMIATGRSRPRLELCTPSEAVQQMFQLASFLTMMSEGGDTRFHEALRRCCGDDRLRRDLPPRRRPGGDDDARRREVP